MFSYRGIIAAMKKLPLILLLALLLAGCATAENSYDPLQPLNRKVDSFNTVVDEVSLRPISKAYTKVIPKEARSSVTNFFSNLQEPNTILNDVLQGKFVQGIADTTRLVINSTFGIVGLFDVAAKVGLEKHKEDLGQTLAVWGVGEGAYIVYPILGPNSVRNTPGTVMAYFIDGATYLAYVMSPQVALATRVLKYIDERANVEDFVKLRDELALDPYIFVREGWRQSREYRIYDGHPPAKPDPSAEDDEFADEFDDDPEEDEFRDVFD